MPTIAELLDYLFETVHPPGRGPYSYAEAADGITEKTGKAITGTTLWKLRTGKQTNPQLDTLKVIAEFFDVPLSYFTDEKTAAEVTKELESLKLLRDTPLGDGHLRALSSLPPEVQDHIAGLIITTAQMEARRRNGQSG